MNVKRIVVTTVGPTALILGWHILSVLLPPGWAPGPMRTVEILISNAANGVLWTNLADTVRRTWLGFLIGFGAGVFVGSLMGLRRVADLLLEYSVFIVMTIPSLAWIIIAILSIGPNEYAGIMVTAVIIFPSVAITVREGVRSLDRGLLLMARSLGNSTSKILRSVVVPWIYPYMFGSARYAISLAWKLTVITELVGLPSGVGRMIDFYYRRLDMGQVFAWTLVITLLILFIDNVILKNIEGVVFKWRKQASI
ncbi:MAG: ABC transporter permease [Candidatus Caldarchaeum sp.]